MDVIVGTVIKNVMIRPAYEEYIMLSTKEAGEGSRGCWDVSKVKNSLANFNIR